MINLESYNLLHDERLAVERMLHSCGNSPTQEQVWQIMDQVWLQCDCEQQHCNPECYSVFYRHPVWLLNGIYIEQDPISMSHRHAIADSVASLGSKRLLDYGGGFGTLARLIADRLPDTRIALFDPFPPAHGQTVCGEYPNIRYVETITGQRYDCLVCTDVLEHVHDPLGLLARMVAAVKPGGHLFIANCFYPVILCHLPCTFHLRHFFSWCAEPLGLELQGPCHGSHAWIYRRRADGSMHLRQARFREALAKVVAPVLTHIAIPARRRLRAWTRARSAP